MEYMVPKAAGASDPAQISEALSLIQTAMYASGLPVFF